MLRLVIYGFLYLQVPSLRYIDEAIELVLLESPRVKSASSHPSPAAQSQTAVDSVPLLDLRRQYGAIRAEVLAAIDRVCDSQVFILGPEVEALEREIAGLTGAADAVGCASGTEALWLALVAAGVQPGDRVITTAFSFFASASAVARAGAAPILLDVDPDTLNLDPAAAERYLKTQPLSTRSGTEAGSGAGSHGGSENSAQRSTASADKKSGPVSGAGFGARSGGSGQSSEKGQIRAILPVHLYGQCADMDAFARLAEECGVALVEDAAQAIGAEWRGRRAGSLGVAAAFSFYPTKNLSAYGDAGMVTTTSAEMATHMRRLRNHGSPRRYYHDELGWNGRMDAIQAAVLRVKLAHIAEWNERRRQHAATYDRLLAAAGLTSETRASTAIGESNAPIKLLARRAEAKHVFHQYVVRAKRRDELRAFLAERRVGSEIYYPLPLHLQPALSGLGLKRGDLPVAERAAEEVLALPMFPELTAPEIQYVVESVAAFYS
jgi:dTDP-4-amino-4,6-dideoxygalactose transaminase